MSLPYLSLHMTALREQRDAAVRELEELKELLRIWAGKDYTNAMTARQWLIEVARDVRHV